MAAKPPCPMHEIGESPTRAAPASTPCRSSFPGRGIASGTPSRASTDMPEDITAGWQSLQRQAVEGVLGASENEATGPKAGAAPQGFAAIGCISEADVSHVP